MAHAHDGLVEVYAVVLKAAVAELVHKVVVHLFGVDHFIGKGEGRDA